MNKLLTVVAAVAVVGFAGTASAQPISQAEMEKLFKGKTFGTEDFGEKGTITFGADGVISIKLQTKSDTGTYRFDKGGYCSTWKVLRTTEACFTAKRLSATQIELLTSDGKHDSTLTIQ